MPSSAREVPEKSGRAGQSFMATPRPAKASAQQGNRHRFRHVGVSAAGACAIRGAADGDVEFVQVRYPYWNLILWILPRTIPVSGIVRLNRSLDQGNIQAGPAVDIGVRRYAVLYAIRGCRGRQIVNDVRTGSPG